MAEFNITDPEIIKMLDGITEEARQDVADQIQKSLDSGEIKRIVEKVNHPDHYGGESNPYEAIKVIEAWDLNFHLGNVVKYISRAGKKSENNIEDLKKAEWYLNRYVEFIQRKSS